MTDRAIVSSLYDSMKLPTIVAPMFLISGPDLVIAAAKAGIIGCFPTPNARTINDLEEWLEKIKSELKGTKQEGMWAINMIVHKSYDRFEAEMALVERYKPKFVVTALGSPTRVLDRVHAFGGKVFADVINMEQAKKAIAAGVDGLILVCSGAGGHTGKYSPFSFVEEVRRFYDGPLIVGGAMQSARSIAALIALGADFAYMGTRFIGCPESLVVDEYRDMLVSSSMDDVVTSDVVSGVMANWLKASLSKAGFDLKSKKGSTEIDFSDIQGEGKAWKDTWGAGHGVSATQNIETVKEIVDSLVDEFALLQPNLANELSRWPKFLKDNNND
ncbi:nitronate monooxygenase [Pseudoalteromonas translucida KMM 520]|uniref:Nitronate monooxygenase n=1 Tax=Pseudoalteromonas translucida KMM 520 TaxID=1315283 RepID=A0A0U2V115_9GAMM|nr:nitronate monooxygenase [Pseudoalteromonas translucida]ALS31837.1 nitronate monooxygenase [Pseudoalteromonas translucida KMM 520]